MARSSRYRLMSGTDCTTTAMTAASAATLISFEIISSAPSPRDRLYLVRREVQEAPVAALQVGGGIIDRRHRQVHQAVHVVQHRLDHCLPPHQEQVLGVRPPGTR